MYSPDKLSELSIIQLCGGVVAQLLERRTGTSIAQVRFPGAAAIFFSLESTFSTDFLTLFVHPRVQLYAFKSVCTLKILSSMSEFGGL